MQTGPLFGVLGLLATTQTKQFDPFLADLTHQGPRTLHHGWANLTVETNTGTFIGMYNDTYPNVRQFLRIPFAQVRQAFHLGFQRGLASRYFACSWLIRSSLAAAGG